MIALNLHLNVYTINSCAVHGYPPFYIWKVDLELTGIALLAV